jgi:hypothetical protein
MKEFMASLSIWSLAVRGNEVEEMTRELFKVTVEYVPPSAVADWEKRLSEHVRKQPSAPFTEPRPRCRTEYHVGVYGNFGAVQINDAATLALSAVVGPQDTWERFQAIVVAAEYVGSVAVTEPDESRCTQEK